MVCEPEHDSDCEQANPDPWTEGRGGGVRPAAQTTGRSGDRRTAGEQSRPIEPMRLVGTRLVRTAGAVGRLDCRTATVVVSHHELGSTQTRAQSLIRDGRILGQKTEGLGLEEKVTITEEDTQSRFSAYADMTTGVVQARGVLDRETLHVLTGAIDLLVSGGHRTVTVNLADVSCVDRAAVVLFAALQHGLYTHDGELRLTNACAEVRDTLVNGQITYADNAS